MIRFDRDEVLRLTQVEADPAVSVLLPVRRSAPHHEADRLRARQLLEEAEVVVRRSYPEPNASTIVHRLRDVADHLDLAHPGDGLAVFVTADEQHVLDVPFPLAEQLTVEEAFATRQLLVGLTRAPTARVLVLSEHIARLFEDRQGRLVELHEAGFPISGVPPREQNTPHRDRPIHERSEAEEHRIAYRTVDDALDEVVATSELPFVVVAADRELAYFEEISRHRRLVVGRVRRDLVRAPVDAIERAVRPAIDAYVADLEARAVGEVVEGIGTGRVITEFGAIWRAAAEGRGRRLVIEDDYNFPLHLTDGLTAGGGPDEPWTLDDAVDELLEHMVRADGDVVFVRPGALTIAGGVALVLRYQG